MNATRALAPLTVLLVEDNLDHAELVTRSLQEHDRDARVTHVTDGARALDYLLRQGDFAGAQAAPRPHVILLDLRLPKVDGLEVLQRVKSVGELRTIPVVVLTTSEAESDVARAQQAHANAYVVKPLEFERFSVLMRDFGLFWLGWNQPPNTAGPQ